MEWGWDDLILITLRSMIDEGGGEKGEGRKEGEIGLKDGRIRTPDQWRKADRD